MTKILLISSTVSIILLLFYITDEIISPDYKQYQTTYRKQLVQFAKNDDERIAAEKFPIAVRQIVSRDLGRTDRCISCHVALEDPRMEGFQEPLKAHPGKLLETHDVQKIGCTVCHDGQGRALSQIDAHAIAIKGWEKPLLPDTFIYSSCLRCHETHEFPEIPAILKEGQEIFFSTGCMGCHKLNGRGGQIGPDLTNIADASTHLKHPVAMEGEEFGRQFHNINIGFIYESIKNPQASSEDTAMMDYNLTDHQVLALTIFLKGLSKKAVPASYTTRLREMGQHETLNGEGLYKKYCVACHGKGAKGGVKNINYAKKTVPAIYNLAEKMFIEYPEDANYIVELLENGTDIVNMEPPLDVEASRRVVAQYQAIKLVIRNGSPAAKLDPQKTGPPLHMPSWITQFTDRDIDSIIAYLLTLQEWEEY